MDTLLSEDNGDALNVIIPLGGIGSRFAKMGYRFPKPLINIAGRPMLLWLIDRLELRTTDSLFIAINDSVNREFHFEMMLAKEYPHLDIHIVALKFDTRGAAETLFIVSQSMTDAQSARRTVSLDCDTIYFPEAQLLSRVRLLPESQGATVVFDDAGDPPVFSYVETDSRNRIVKIKEKVAISRKANTGAYVFPNGFQLRLGAAAFLDQAVDELALGEYYTSALLSSMIESGITFLTIQIPSSSFACVGTPVQLTEFLRTIMGKPELVKLRRFCWDLDSTLVTPPSIAGDYSTCKPIKRNIDLLKQLHAAGHYIIVYTARRMRTHHGNVGAVIRDIGKVTLQTLDDFGIPYHEIHYGKPYAHVYIDDLAVNALLDTQREIGWYAPPQESVTGEAQTKGMLVPRSFNTVQVIGNAVVKSSTSDAILGEIYYLSRVPDDIQDLFPSVTALDYAASTQSFSITMQRVHGVTFSHLLVGRALTTGRFEKFLAGLARIHASDGKASSTCALPASLQSRVSVLEAAPDQHIDVYANYHEKVNQRYTTYEAIYASLGDDHAVLARRLLDFLADFQLDQRGIPVHAIHGDPVFSNAIFASDNTVVFIDVRGRQGDVLTTSGDAMYDLSKVLQSLQGYDFALLSDPAAASTASLPQLLPEIDQRLLQELEACFWAFVKKNYKLDGKDLILLTAALLFSLIPLHDPPMRPMFYQMCKKVMASV